MRSSLFYLSFSTSATVLGHWHHPKPSLRPRDALGSDASNACADIKSQISSASEVIDGVGKCCASAEWRPLESQPGACLRTFRLIEIAVELGLTDDTHHWFFESSSETPTCVVEVGSPADVSIAVRLEP